MKVIRYKSELTTEQYKTWAWDWLRLQARCWWVGEKSKLGADSGAPIAILAMLVLMLLCWYYFVGFSIYGDGCAKRSSSTSHHFGLVFFFLSLLVSQSQSFSLSFWSTKGVLEKGNWYRLYYEEDKRLRYVKALAF